MVWNKEFIDGLIESLKTKVCGFEYKEQVEEYNKKKREKYICPTCDNRKSKNSMLCRKCSFKPKVKKQVVRIFVNKNHMCPNCKNAKDAKAVLCKECFSLSKRKVERPNKEELEKLVKELSMTKIGKMFGVSDNAVKKWCKIYEIELGDRRGYWAKIYAR
ncbi:MAG: hypothetical protein M0P71_01570 [Melioribacteraceae bacterium]|nr:hypothetical protein [Melioribacteraceae bacterium]